MSASYGWFGRDFSNHLHRGQPWFTDRYARKRAVELAQPRAVETHRGIQGERCIRNAHELDIKRSAEES